MVRAALQQQWDCVFANDIDPMKCDVYRQNWGSEALRENDIARISDADLRQQIDLYWASSPCQDFSLAGKGLGLDGHRSGIFSIWADKVSKAVEAGFGPRIIAFENVVGLLTRNSGKDFAHVLERLNRIGYVVGAMEIDARYFLPQSRPRIFVIAVRSDVDMKGLHQAQGNGLFHSKKLQNFVNSMPDANAKNWVWWRHPIVKPDVMSLMNVIDGEPNTSNLSPESITRLLGMMSGPNQRRVMEARKTGHLEIGALYKRGRPDQYGKIRQRAEVRFDGVAGCLRTPSGGSSRQTLLFVKGNETQARLLSSKELSRLMGLNDSFVMPARYNSAYKVAGDGVAVPIVSYLNEHIFLPILRAAKVRVAA